MDQWGWYTYYGSGHQHVHLDGVAAAVADRLVPMITTTNERIMRLKISDIFGVIF